MTSEHPPSPTQLRLRSTRRILWRREIFRSAYRFAIGLGAILLLAGGVRFWRGLPPFSLPMMGGGLIAWTALVVFWAGVQRPSILKAAATLDEFVSGASDRFSTWLQVSGSIRRDVWSDAILREIDAFASRVPLPVRIPASSFRRLMVVLGVVLFAGAGIDFAFRLRLAESADERSMLATLLDSAAKDAASEEQLSDLVEQLENESTRLRETPVAAPREMAVRSLAEAAAKVRAQATEGVAGSKNANASPNAGAQALKLADSETKPASLNAATGNSAAAIDPASAEAIRRRLDRLAQRMEDRKREAAGLGSKRQNEESGTPGKGNDSLLAELAKPGSSSAPGENDSGLPFGGPGSDHDRGPGGTSPPVDPVTPSRGPDLLVSAAPGDSQNAVSFSAISAESQSELSTQKREGPVIPLEFMERSLAPEDIPIGARDMVRRYFESLNATE